MPSATIAWGIYARSCVEVDAFVRACLGCDDANYRTLGVALIDAPRTRDAAPYENWRCGRVLANPAASARGDEPARCFLKTGEKSSRYGHGAFNRPLPCRDGSQCVSGRVARNGSVVRLE